MKTIVLELKDCRKNKSVLTLLAKKKCANLPVFASCFPSAYSSEKRCPLEYCRCHSNATSCDRIATRKNEIQAKADIWCKDLMQKQADISILCAHSHAHTSIRPAFFSSADSDAACVSKPSHDFAHPPTLLASHERKRRQPLTSLLRRRDLKIASSHLQSDVAKDYLRVSILCTVCGHWCWREENATELDNWGVKKVDWKIMWKKTDEELNILNIKGKRRVSLFLWQLLYSER